MKCDDIQELILTDYSDKELSLAQEKEIAQHSKGWTMARMSSVDRNVLRVALAEFDLKQAPPKVIINEAIEIAKEFGSAESGAFVNGILDKVWATIDPDAREQKG